MSSRHLQPVNGAHDPFVLPRTPEEIRADLAMQLQQIITRWQRRIDRDRIINRMSPCR